ncbi:hypothetical protein MPDQ_006583 [Monascus purpureus]|uniref:BAG domain-containing protein n=1 Tax=Monascus purpureus TaxID=5098 RepID=A0A507R7D7_MONPU|nr:hypothetical protein MPDQ_006583 [Monascus purpureus]BDD60705.1 hypothetical protein MAP00_005804 [Monascus purpureus]
MSLLSSTLAQSTLAKKGSVYLDSVANNLLASLHSLQEQLAPLSSTKFPSQISSLARHFHLEQLVTVSPVTFLLTVITCISTFIAIMSWRSPFGIFRRSPYSNFTAVPQVSDRDFSYITPDELINPPSREYREEYPATGDAGPDILLLKHRGTTYPLHFPAYAIDDGALTVGELRRRAAEATGSLDLNRVKLLYKGRLLMDDSRPCKTEGLKQQSKVLCVVSEVDPGESTASEVSDSELERASDASEKNGRQTETITDSNIGKTQNKKRNRNRNRNRNKKNKNRQAVEVSAVQSTPSSGGTGCSSLPPPSPNLKDFSTPLEQVNALVSYFRSVLLPLCNEYVANPPPLGKVRDFEYKKLSETVLAQVILKADGIDPSGHEETRTARRALIKEVQASLNSLDQVPRE